MIGWNYKGPLIFYISGKDRGNITIEDYLTKIFPFIKRRKTQLESKYWVFIFQEDNDSGHDTKSLDNPIQLHKDTINLNYINDWPLNSPNFNPIKHIWRILKQQVKWYKYITKEQLQDAIETEWDKILYKEINNYILGKDMHIRKCMEQAIERGRFAT